jgi:hypothetical protein
MEEEDSEEEMVDTEETELHLRDVDLEEEHPDSKTKNLEDTLISSLEESLCNNSNRKIIHTRLSSKQSIVRLFTPVEIISVIELMSAATMYLCQKKQLMILELFTEGTEESLMFHC